MLLKISASKAAGSETTEAYPCGRSQVGIARERSLGKQRVLARWGCAGGNVGIFSSRLREAERVYEPFDRRGVVAGQTQLFVQLTLFQVHRQHGTFKQQCQK